MIRFIDKLKAVGVCALLLLGPVSCDQEEFLETPTKQPDRRNPMEIGNQCRYLPERCVQ